LFASPRSTDQPLTLGERLDRLNNTLQSLTHQLKDAIASAISSAVAGAVRDAVRSLLGPGDEPAEFRERPYRDWEEPAYPDWDRPDRPLWHEDQDNPHDRRLESAPRRGIRSRWSEALGVAVQAGLCWLRHQPRRRPVLTAVVVAVAAGLTALLAGPAVGAGAGVLASTAGLLLTADAIDPALDRPAG
jgi:hypothetical protein